MVLTVIATVAVPISGRRLTSRDTKQALEVQREQLKTTLAAQRKQLDDTLAEQRTRTLNERFATAAEQLGFNKPSAVRLAGVYAMAGLADDWRENRQTCVDVLCGYLRLPYNPDPGESANPNEESAYQRNREVRQPSSGSSPRTSRQPAPQARPRRSPGGTDSRADSTTGLNASGGALRVYGVAGSGQGPGSGSIRVCPASGAAAGCAMAAPM